MKNISAVFAAACMSFDMEAVQVAIGYEITKIVNTSGLHRLAEL
ncbi:hypothetical protein [Nitrosomonas ureae]|nr:hypothetical protein [Nitrosomonas ureae]